MAEDIIDLLKIKIEKAKRDLPEDTQNAIAAVDWRTAILELRARKGYTFEQLGDLELETELLLSGLTSAEDYPKELIDRMKISKTEANDLVKEMNNSIFRKIREELVKNTERRKAFAKNNPESKENVANDARVLNSAGIEIIPSRTTTEAAIAMAKKETLPVPEKLELGTVPPVQSAKENIPPVQPPVKVPEPAPLPPEKGMESRDSMIEKIEKPEMMTHPILSQKLSSSVQTGVVRTEHLSENATPGTSADIPKKPAVDPYREVPE